MKMAGEQTLNAPREAVWDALNDAEVLKMCIPGCQELTKTSDTSFAAVAQAKVGPVKAKFKGNVTLSDIDAPNGYTISGEGSGGAAGFAKGAAKVSLADGEPGQTVLTYDVDANVGGKLAQIGSRLVDGAAKKMADEFFSNFSAHFGDASEGEPADTAEESPTDVASADQETANEAAAQESSSGRSMNPLVWIIVLGLAAALLFYLSR